MAQCKLTPHEYLQNAFAPQVAILCSEDADNLCLKNNLRFVELIQPFCRLNNEIRIADPSGNTVPIRNLRVVFEDMNRRPPQPTLGKKLLSEVVSTAPWDRPTTRAVGASGTREALELELQPTTPWFEAWRDTFLHVQYPSDHEFTKHYIACIVAVASTSENPMDQLNRLSQYQHQQLHQTPARFPKWFSPNILKFYLLIHDITAGDLTKSEQVFEQMTSMYGSSNCHLLQINSRHSDQTDVHLPDPWSQFLIQRASCEPSGGSSSEASSGTGTPREDVSGLPSRVTEGDTADCCEPIHPLSPTVLSIDEKNGNVDMMPGVEISADVPVMVNRPSLPAGTAQHHGGCLTSSDVDRIRIFVHEFCVRSLIPHVERQIRHLNDVVTNRSRSKSLLSATRRWLVGNKSPGSATNSVIYSPEATELQTRRLGDLCFMFGLYELAYSFYHTAKNDFKSDQAWLYFAGAQEMAALAAFMQNSSDYPKRYLENSLQTYLNVCKVYATRGWVLAEDHIHFTLGKQAHHLKQLTEGLEAYNYLVDQRQKENASSQQSPAQQMTYVREFFNTFHQYIQQEWDSSTGVPCLPLPLIDSQETRVLLGAPQDPPTNCEWTAASHVSLDSDEISKDRWFALERELFVKRCSSMVFRPNLQLLTSDTPNTQSPVVPVNEPVVVEVLMKNPLAVSLMISDVRLVFTFEPSSNQEIVGAPVQDTIYPGCNLPAGAQEKVRLELHPQCTGKLLIKGVIYKLCLTPDMTSGVPPGSTTTPVIIEGQQNIEVKGPRLNTTSVEKCSVVYANDKRLEITVMPPMSRLSVIFHDIPQILSCGELCSTDVMITNIGPCPVSKLKLAVSDPNHVYLDIQEAPLPGVHICVLSDSETKDGKITSRTETLALPNGVLNPGDVIKAKLWLHAPMSPGAFDVELLFWYDTLNSPGKIEYRLLRHFSSIYVERSLSLKASSTMSQNLQEFIGHQQENEGVYSYTSNLIIEAHNNSEGVPDLRTSDLRMPADTNEVDSSCSSYTVVGLSGNSGKWAVVPHSNLQGQQLRPGESCHLCVKCVQHAKKGTSGMILSQLHFGSSQVPLNSWWRFSLRERVSLRDLLTDPPPPKPNADHIPPPPTQAQQDAKHIAAVNSLDMVVTVIWKGERGGHETWGQHSVHLKSLGDSVSIPSSPLIQAGEEEKPPIRIIPESPPQILQSPLPPAFKQKHLVKISAHFPDCMEHDFMTNRLCSIEFELCLHNCSACQLTTFLNLCPEGLPNSNGNVSSHVYSPQASTELLYVGGTVRKVNLLPWGHTKVPVRVLINSPGTYSLGVFSVTAIRHEAAKDKYEQPIPQACQLQTAVTVRQVPRGDHHLSHNT
ncbi:trafficking protein particle complex subunit 8-like isoform X3 [Homarus americanus]|uniref:trafficking protein particle complex subunit 8-like isoform X3 n=1 Tax=Homarus americanus TaxID=6706 RepID=UPI001C44EE7C|nr:trafficking protein particle complex subunit 8-like isoform X3 [Homarus americanus]